MPNKYHTIQISGKTTSFALCKIGEELNANIDEALKTGNPKITFNALRDYFSHRSKCRFCSEYHS